MSSAVPLILEFYMQNRRQMDNKEIDENHCAKICCLIIVLKGNFENTCIAKLFSFYAYAQLCESNGTSLMTYTCIIKQAEWDMFKMQIKCPLYT